VDIDLLLNVLPAALGMRGTTAAVIAAIERGGASSSADPEWVLDTQLGWGRGGVNNVARFRELEGPWRQLSPAARAIHVAHYEPRQLPRGAAAYLLASDGKTSLAGVTLVLCSPEERVRLATAARRLDEQPSSWAAGGDGKQCVRTIKELAKRAVEPVKAAHLEWYGLLRGEAEGWVAA
jgi:hypothetical protein